MNSHPRILWPQFVLLIALFILCLFAPDIWRSTGNLVHDSSPPQQDGASGNNDGQEVVGFIASHSAAVQGTWHTACR